MGYTTHFPLSALPLPTLPAFPTLPKKDSHESNTMKILNSKTILLGAVAIFATTRAASGHFPLDVALKLEENDVIRLGYSKGVKGLCLWWVVETWKKSTTPTE